MGVRRVSAEEAHRLMQEGWSYVDVRSVPEFEAGHPAGAWNVPLIHLGPRGMYPNPEFMTVMQQRFPKDARLILGCRSGNRSFQAAQILAAAGYAEVVDQRAGYDGAHDPLGHVLEPGWKTLGLPTATQASPERTWQLLQGDGA